MDDDDVSVADLLIREGWDDHEESRAKSRWRVIAVVIAVVVACGAAGVLVGFDSDPEQNAQPNNMSVIEMPKRPSENRGADATSAAPSTETVETGEGEPSSRPSKTTSSSRRTSSSAASTSDTPDESTTTPTSHEPADPPKPTGSTGPPHPPGHTPPPPTTTPTEECNLWPKWLWC